MPNVFDTPFGVQWRHALVRLDRLVPVEALRFLLLKQPPYPIVLRIPARDHKHVSVHIYLPLDQELPEDGFPVHLDFHGGDFCFGSPTEQAVFCSMLSRELSKVVISVDYRMGPTHRFPKAIEDAEDVLCAVLDPASEAGSRLRQDLRAALSKASPRGPPKPISNSSSSTHYEAQIVDPTRLSLSGFSSGGNIALNLVISVSTHSTSWPSRIPLTGVHPLPVLLFFPSFDQRQLSFERPLPEHLRPDPSKEKKSRLNLKLNQVLAPTYLPEEDRRHPRACPGLCDMKDSLHSRARIFLVLAEIDSLRPQSEDWVQRMERCGKGDVLQVERFEGMRHGWTQFPDPWLKEREKVAKREAFERAVKFLGKVERVEIEADE